MRSIGNLHNNFGIRWKKFVQNFCKKNLTLGADCGKIGAGLRPRAVADAQPFIIPQRPLTCQKQKLIKYNLGFQLKYSFKLCSS